MLCTQVTTDVLQHDCTKSLSHQQQNSLLSLSSLSVVGASGFLIFANLVGVKLHLTVISMCVSQITNDIGPSFYLF